MEWSLENSRPFQGNIVVATCSLSFSIVFVETHYGCKDNTLVNVVMFYVQVPQYGCHQWEFLNQRKGIAMVSNIN